MEKRVVTEVTQKHAGISDSEGSSQSAHCHPDVCFTSYKTNTAECSSDQVDNESKAGLCLRTFTVRSRLSAPQMKDRLKKDYSVLTHCVCSLY